MSDSEDDPYLQALVGIAGELRAIRLELERANRKGEDDLEAFDCRCGETVEGERNARRHAIDDHGAPVAHWQELYA